MSACRSCGAPIWWARTHHDYRIPMNVHPADDGNVVMATAEGDVLEGDELEGARTSGQSYVVVIGPGMAPGIPRWRTHFSTCPNAAEHRR